MRLHPGNAQAIGARDKQQDAFAFSDADRNDFVAHGGLLAVVADGMGGLHYGGAASATAVRTFLSAYEEKQASESIPDALTRSLSAARAAVLALARDADLVEEMGTTLSAAVAHGAELHWISVGDSRIYLARDGSVSQLTTDHTYAAELDAKAARGEIRRTLAREDKDREALTSYVGSPEPGAVDRSEAPVPLCEGDRVIVCSDGLYRMLSTDEMAAESRGEPLAMCEALVQRVLQKTHPRQDNVTVAVIGCEAERRRLSGLSRERRLLILMATLALVLAGCLLALPRVERWLIERGGKPASTQEVAR